MDLGDNQERQNLSIVSRYWALALFLFFYFLSSI